MTSRLPADLHGAHVRIDAGSAIYRVPPATEVPIFGVVADLHDAVKRVTRHQLVTAASMVLANAAQSFKIDGATVQLLWGDGDASVVTMLVTGQAGSSQLATAAIASACALASRPNPQGAVSLHVEATLMAHPAAHTRRCFALPWPIARPSWETDLGWALAESRTHPTGSGGRGWRGDVNAAAALAGARGGDFLRSLFLVLVSARAHRMEPRMARWVWETVAPGAVFPA